MWKIRASKIKPYWVIQNGNKPHPASFRKFLKEAMEEVVANINFVDFLTAEVVLPMTNGTSYHYFELINTTTDEVKFFYIDSVNVVQGNRKVFKAVLDVYTTYTIPFIERNADVSVIQNRTPRWKNLMTLRVDPDLANISPNIQKYEFVKNHFPSYTDIENLKWYRGNDMDVSGGTNGCKYAIFNDGPNFNYMMVPIFDGLIKPPIIKGIGNNGVMGEGIKFEHQVWQGFYPETFIKKPANLKDVLIKAKNDRKHIEFNYTLPVQESSTSPIFWEQHQINLNFPINPDDLECVIENEVVEETNLKGKIVIKIGGFTYVEHDYYLVSGPMAHATDIYLKMREMMQFVIHIYDTFVIQKGFSMESLNSEFNINQMIKSPEWSNKFVGYYVGPNFLQIPGLVMSNIIYEEKRKCFIRIFISKEGIDIFPMEWDFSLKKPTEWNSTINSHEVINITPVKFKNNNIQLIKFSNNNKIKIGGKLIFSDGFFLIGKQATLTNVEDSIISYGGLLPSANSSYLQYLNSQRASINTGYSIKKAEYELNQYQTAGNMIINGLASGISSFGSLIASPGGGAFVGPLGAVLPGIFNGLTNMDRSRIQFDNYKQELISKFQDAKNTMGNNVQMGTTLDASLITNMLDKNDQYELLEVGVLTDYAKMFVNNFVLLYGHYNPYRTTMGQLLQTSQLYLELADDQLENALNLSITEEPMVWEMIKTQLINGLLIWKQDEWNQIFIPWEVARD